MNLTTEETMAKVSNAADTARNHTVRATVYKDENGAFKAIREGQVYTNGNSYVAWFNCGVTEPLSISFASPDISAAEQSTVISEILGFIAEVKKPATENAEA